MAINKFQNQLLFIGLLLLSSTMPSVAANNDGSNGLPIHQEIIFQCPADVLYSALTRESEFGEFTGFPAQISQEAGGAFSLFGDQISGRHIELERNTILVQAWRVATWPKGVYSLARFSFSAMEGSTRITLDHNGYPEGTVEHLNSGWYEMYWNPLKAYCE